MSNVSQVERFFHYQPVTILSEIAIAVFAIVAVVLTVIIIRRKADKWLYILVGTAVAEALGYVFRAISARNATLGLYIGMSLFLLLSPNALALVNYKTIGKVIQLSNVKDKRFWLNYKFVTWFFFASDIFSFLLQGAGGGMMAMDGKQVLGKNIAMIGLVLQLLFLAMFVFICVYVSTNTRYIYDITTKDPLIAKNRLMRTMFLTTALIYIRSVYRVIEYGTGFDGAVAKAEWAFYVFDALAILSAFLVYILWFIGDDLPKRSETKAYYNNLSLQ
jgi:hypothetical protein